MQEHIEAKKDKKEIKKISSISSSKRKKKQQKSLRGKENAANDGCLDALSFPPPHVPSKNNGTYNFHLWDDLDWLTVKELNFRVEDLMLEQLE